MTSITHLPASSGLARPVGLAVLAMVSIQLAAGLSRPLVAEIGAPAVTWIRMAVAAAVMLALTRPRLRGMPRRAVLAAMLLGAALAIMAVAYFAAVSRLSLGMVSAIAFLGPLAVAVVGARGRQSAGLALLAGAGVFLLVGPFSAVPGSGWAFDPLGLGLASLAAFGFAAYILLTRRVGVLFSGTDGMTISLLTAALLLTPFGVGGLDRVPSLPVILGCAGLAILAPLLTFLLEMSALRKLGTQCFSTLISLEPAIAAVLGLVLLHEVPNLPQALGMVCVVVASAGAVKLSAAAAPG
jgi:inner membrane transporter RhtA